MAIKFNSLFSFNFLHLIFMKFIFAHFFVIFILFLDSQLILIRIMRKVWGLYSELNIL